MERIKKAVEQARRERELAAARSVGADAKNLSHGHIDGAADTPGWSVYPAQESAAKEASAPAPDSIEYTETRLITVSQAVRKRTRLVAGITDHPLQDTYRMLRTRVLQEMKANNWTTIAVTSPATGSGKSLTAVNLAITIARDLSQTALLVDGDLRRPSVHDYFEYKPEFGINDYLFNDIPLQKILFHPDMSRLTVLPGRESVPESAEALASPKIVALCSELRSRYSDRIVVYDIAPVLSVDDALVLAPNVDCMLMVAESGVTTREELRRSLELLNGVPIVGTVLNKVQKKVSDPY